MEHRELLDSVALYAFGVLPESERIEVEAHLANGCAECSAALRQALEVAGALADAAPRIEPSPNALEALRARIASEAAPRAQDAPRSSLLPRLARGRRLALPLAAALAAAALLGLQVWRLATSLDAERAQRVALASDLDAARSELESARAESDRMRTAGSEASARAQRLQELVALLTERDTRSILLAGQASAPGASARAYLSPAAHQLLLFVYDLPPTPPGHTYQLWVIVEGKPPISAGVFAIDADGRARHQAFTPPDVTGPVTIAVSVEPAGGVPAPTGPIVLAGS